jgi:hypothetical protein
MVEQKADKSANDSRFDLRGFWFALHALCREVLTIVPKNGIFALAKSFFGSRDDLAFGKGWRVRD